MRKLRRPLLLLSAVAVLAAGVAALIVGCARERTVRVAVAVPLTGDVGTEGQGVRRAVELAVEEANASHRLPFRVEVEPFDDRNEPAEAFNVANLIISDPRIVAVIGHYTSGCALAAARVYAAAPVAMISPSATAPELTLQQTRADWQGPRVVFRMAPTDEVQGRYAADYARERLRKRRIALVHDGTPYGISLVSEFKRAFIGGGGRVALEARVSPGQRDYSKLVADLADARPDAIYFGGVYTEAGLLLKALRSSSLKTAAFLGGDGVRTPGLFDVAGDAADGAYATLLGEPDESGFVSAYAKRWPDEPLRPYDFAAYQAARIALDALAQAGPDRAKLLEAVRASRRFDAKGDTQNRAVHFLRARVKDRSFVAS